MTTMDEKSAIDAMTAVCLPEEDYVLKRLGITLRIRGLSHAEGLALRDYAEDKTVSTAKYEQRMLSAALIFPKMTEKDVAAWQRAAPSGEMGEVMRVVGRLSGLLKDSAKEAYKSIPAESGPGE